MAALAAEAVAAPLFALLVALVAMGSHSPQILSAHFIVTALVVAAALVVMELAEAPVDLMLAHLIITA